MNERRWRSGTLHYIICKSKWITPAWIEHKPLWRYIYLSYVTDILRILIRWCVGIPARQSPEPWSGARAFICKRQCSHSADDRFGLPENRQREVTQQHYLQLGMHDCVRGHIPTNLHTNEVSSPHIKPIIISPTCISPMRVGGKLVRWRPLLKFVIASRRLSSKPAHFNCCGSKPRDRCC